MKVCRILFVDDEPRVLEGLENLLFDIDEDWEVEFASGGAEALTRLADSSFDVLVTDMRMPGMDGAELLARTRKRFPEVIRIVLSGHTEEEEAARAMPFAHEFLSKPCDVNALVGTLQRAIKLTNRFADMALRSALGEMESLPSRSETHLRITEAIEADAGISEIADIVSSEVALVAKVMQVANTAFYSRGRRVSTAQQAVSLLGLRVTSSVVLAVGTFEQMGVPSWLGIEQLHRHSIEVGTIAAQIVTPGCASDALLAGMLHDVGRLVLAVDFVEEALRAIGMSEDGGINEAQAERIVLGFDHASIGGYLLGLWHLSDDVAQAIETHHQTGLEERSELGAALFAADWVTHHPTRDVDNMLSEVERDMVSAARRVLEAPP